MGSAFFRLALMQMSRRLFFDNVRKICSQVAIIIRKFISLTTVHVLANWRIRSNDTLLGDFD